MPNWCENKLYVTGTEEQLKKFDKAFTGREPHWPLTDNELRADITEEEAQALKDENEVYYMDKEEAYRLNALYPVPDDILAKGFHRPKPDGKSWFEPNEPTHDGRSWCSHYWGTKWDIDEVTVEKQEDCYMYFFDSAWAPPEEWLTHVAKDWPDLRFWLVYSETGNGFAGEVTIEGGEVKDDHYLTFDGENVLAYRGFVEEHFDYDPLEGQEEDDQDD